MDPWALDPSRPWPQHSNESNPCITEDTTPQTPFHCSFSHHTESSDDDNDDDDDDVPASCSFSTGRRPTGGPGSIKRVRTSPCHPPTLSILISYNASRALIALINHCFASRGGMISCRWNTRVCHLYVLPDISSQSACGMLMGNPPGIALTTSIEFHEGQAGTSTVCINYYFFWYTTQSKI